MSRRCLVVIGLCGVSGTFLPPLRGSGSTLLPPPFFLSCKLQPCMLLPPPISLAYSFNLACLLCLVPGRPASPGHALPPSISLATSFNLVCWLASLVPKPSLSPAPLAPASPSRQPSFLPAP